MSLKISKSVDATGLTCPEPVMMLHNAVRDAEGGEVLRVIASDPSTQKDIAHFCEFLGHELISSTCENDIFVFLIRKRSV